MNFSRLCGIAALCFGAAGTAAALDCSPQIAEAASALEAAAKQLKPLPDSQRKKEVHMLVDDARMYLHGAKHNQEKPQGALDIARCMAKSGAALGYARAATALAIEPEQTTNAP